MVIRWIFQIKTKLKGYLNETSVHGLRYLVVSRNNFERAIWLIVICICMAISLTMVIQNCFHFRDDPILRTIDTTVVQNVSKSNIFYNKFLIFCFATFSRYHSLPSQLRVQVT